MLLIISVPKYTFKPLVYLRLHSYTSTYPPCHEDLTIILNHAGREYEDAKVYFLCYDTPSWAIILTVLFVSAPSWGIIDNSLYRNKLGFMRKRICDLFHSFFVLFFMQGSVGRWGVWEGKGQVSNGHLARRQSVYFFRNQFQVQLQGNGRHQFYACSVGA